jgi:hypothetical protein
MANPNPSPATRFRDGHKGGPGRPRSKPLTDRLREVLDDPGQVDRIVRRWVELAEAGDASALRQLLDRVEGKLTDRVELDGDVTIRVEYADGPPAAASQELGETG